MMKKKVRTIIGLTALICTIGMNLETNWLYADEGDFITEDSADEQNFIVKSSADTGEILDEEEAKKILENGGIITETWDSGIDYNELIESSIEFDDERTDISNEEEALDIFIEKKNNELEKEKNNLFALESEKNINGITKDIINKTKENIQKLKEEINNLTNLKSNVLSSDIATFSNVSSSKDLSNSSYFPNIRNQGSKGSCVYFSSIYYSYTYMANSMNKINSKILSNCYSPEWLYIQMRGDGALQTERQFDYLKHNGCVKWYECEYSGNVNSDKTINSVSEDAMMNAFTTKIDKWGTVINHFNTTPITSVNGNTELMALKNYLINGIPLHINVSFKFNEKIGSNNEIFAIREYRIPNKNTGHAMTVVGYDDNIWCDVNGNNKCDAGEKGAFKVANSHGTGFANNGYIWILYDALNGQSQISGNWEKDLEGERLPAFGDKVFYFTVRACKPTVVGKVEYKNVTFDNLGVSLYTSRNSAKLEQAKITPDLKEQNITSVVKLYDYTDDAKSYDRIIGGTRFYLNYFTQNSNSSKPFSNVKFTLVDNKFNQVSGYSSYITNTGTYNIYKNFVLGDINYDGNLKEDDVKETLNYALNITTDYSNLQAIMADYNHDGKINLDDVVAFRKVLQ